MRAILPNVQSYPLSLILLFCNNPYCFTFSHFTIICRTIISSSDDSSKECKEDCCDDLTTDSHDHSSSSEDEMHCLKKPTSPIK